MTFDIACVLCGDSLPHWPRMEYDIARGNVIWIENHSNELSPCQAYQRGLGHSANDILIYLHSDLEIIDPLWLEKVIDQFTSSVVAVGLGGAISLGNKDLYRKPFDIRNMARGGYASNQVDAETHGERFTGSRRVAVLEQFFMAIRTDWLRSIGGWPVQHLTHHLLDAFIACEAARGNKEIRMVGVECRHYGGGASVGPKYAEAKWLIGGTTDSDHRLPHLYIFDKYRDCLPLETK